MSDESMSEAIGALLAEALAGELVPSLVRASAWARLLKQYRSEPEARAQVVRAFARVVAESHPGLAILLCDALAERVGK